MTKKKEATKAVAPRKAISLAKRKDTSPKFESMNTLLSKDREDIKAQEAYDIIMLACQVFDLPPQGITVLGNAPYINKIGWKIKQNEFAADSTIKLTWVHRALPNEKYAIVDAEMFDKDGKYMGSATGEAEPTNIKLAAVQKTLNMMAETRAKNRVLADVLVAKTYEKAIKKMAEMKLSAETQRKVGEIARTSAEEQNEKEETVAPPQTKGAEAHTNYVEKLKIALFKRGAKTIEEASELIEKKAGTKIKEFEDLSEDQARDILQKLMI